MARDDLDEPKPPSLPWRVFAVLGAIGFAAMTVRGLTLEQLGWFRLAVAVGGSWGTINWLLIAMGRNWGDLWDWLRRR